jgi:UTP--glucose-1-phosphate uridylyltransferase
MVVEPVPERAANLPYVELDKRYYKLLDRFEHRFPHGPPSLKEAERLAVQGDFTFDAGVTVKGAVTLRAEKPQRITAGAVLQG